MSILHKAIYRPKAIPTKIPMAYFTDLEQNLNICTQTKKTLKSLSNLEKEGSQYLILNYTIRPL